MGIQIIDIVYDFCLISALMLISKILRTRIRIIQRLYIPVALIAGFLGLLLGDQFLGLLPFSNSISSYSGILITVLFASMFLGNKTRVSFRSMLGSVGDSFFVNAAVEISQYGIFILIGVTVLPLLFPGINDAFGLLLPAGFIGGHGTAAAIGSTLAASGWDEATSIGQTFATIGLLVGVICGVIIINIGVRKGYTKIIQNVGTLSEDVKTGLISAEKRESAGEATVSAISIDTLTWHLSLVLVAVGAAYLANGWLKSVFPQFSFPVYGLALLCSIGLGSILRIVKLADYVDKKTIGHIGSSATDYLVAFGVASININVVVKYWIPILVLAILGIVFSFLWFSAYPHLFRNYWFERGLYIFGMATGVMATGVILLRITDPDFRSGVLEDFGFAWIFLSILDMLLVSFSPVVVVNNGGVPYSVVLLCLSGLCVIFCRKCLRVSKRKNRNTESMSEEYFL